MFEKNWKSGIRGTSVSFMDRSSSSWHKFLTINAQSGKKRYKRDIIIVVKRNFSVPRLQEIYSAWIINSLFCSAEFIADQKLISHPSNRNFSVDVWVPISPEWNFLGTLTHQKLICLRQQAICQVCFSSNIINLGKFLLFLIHVERVV